MTVAVMTVFPRKQIVTVRLTEQMEQWQSYEYSVEQFLGSFWEESYLFSEAFSYSDRDRRLFLL